MSIADLFFPKFCLGCGSVGTYICPTCLSRLKPVERDVCIYCRKPSYAGLTHHSCIHKLNISGFTAVFYYDNFLKKIIKNIKYRLATSVWDEFSRAIKPSYLGKLAVLKKIAGPAFLQPVPLSKKRLNMRGFNQSALIANFFNRYLGLGIGDFLIRKNDSPPQAQAGSKTERYTNIRGAFGLRPDTAVYGKTIILVDDVVTSGATMKEAASALKRGGAPRVFALSIAMG